jgi:hypothetical protein
MKYVFWTLAIEAALFTIWIFYKAYKEIKEEERERMETWNLWE